MNIRNIFEHKHKHVRPNQYIALNFKI